MLKLEESDRIESGEKSENERSDYVQMSLGKKSENNLEEVLLVI